MIHNFLILLFSCRGRVDRLTFLKGRIGQILSFLLGIALIFIPGLLQIGRNGSEPSPFISVMQLLMGLTYVLGFVLLIVTQISMVILDIKRLRDIGLSPWWVILNLIPILGLLVGIAYFFIPSDYFSKTKLHKKMQGLEKTLK